MEYFDINRYKGWDNDPYYSSSENHKFLKKEDEKIEIFYHTSGIQVRVKNSKNPYEVVNGFSNKTRRLLARGYIFYSVNYGIWKEYDEQGRLIKETDWDKDYEFSLDSLVKKMSKEYEMDLFNTSKTRNVSRYVEKEHLHLPLYEVWYRAEANTNEFHCYIIDGNTGETLFDIVRFMGDEGDGKGSLLGLYLKSLKEEKNK
jgi:hypothetical protein